MASEASRAPRFFVLTDAVYSRYDTEYERAPPVNRGVASYCMGCGSFLGMLPWLRPHRVALEVYGSEPGDFVEGAGYEVLISERFAEAFLAEGLTGFEGFHPVEVVKTRHVKGKRVKKPLESLRYRVVSPGFGRVMVDVVRNRMRFKWEPTCRECQYTEVDGIYGFVLRAGNWREIGRAHV